MSFNDDQYIYSQLNIKQKQLPYYDMSDPCCCKYESSKTSICCSECMKSLLNWCLNTICCSCLSGCTMCCSCKEYRIFNRPH